MNDIHSRIKTLRLNLGLSMEALGKAVGVSWQTVQQWERENETAPKRDRLQKKDPAFERALFFILLQVSLALLEFLV